MRSSDPKIPRGVQIPEKVVEKHAEEGTSEWMMAVTDEFVEEYALAVGEGDSGGVGDVEGCQNMGVGG